MSMLDLGQPQAFASIRPSASTSQHEGQTQSDERFRELRLAAPWDRSTIIKRDRIVRMASRSLSRSPALESSLQPGFVVSFFRTVVKEVRAAACRERLS